VISATLNNSRTSSKEWGVNALRKKPRRKKVLLAAPNARQKRNAGEEKTSKGGEKSVRKGHKVKVVDFNQQKGKDVGRKGKSCQDKPGD